jgi:hypothetical protein
MTRGAAAPASFYRPETYQPDESAAYLMRRILSCMAAEVDEALEPARPDQRPVGAAAQAAHGRSLHRGRTGAPVPAGRGAMTRMLDRLEAKGLVARVRSSRTAAW